eukprot:9275448-Alexandrium_andersonii.AAC.1
MADGACMRLCATVVYSKTLSSALAPFSLIAATPASALTHPVNTPGIKSVSGELSWFRCARI